jgi:tetratricopeptide (TPR) repeat protein
LIAVSPKEGENQIGITSMQTAASNNLILTSFSSSKRFADVQSAIKQGEFYQHILSGLIKGVYTKQVFTVLGNKLITLAEYAYSLRRMEIVRQASQFLLNLPLANEYRSLGQYYEVLCMYREGQFIEARNLLERVAEKVPARYRARVLVSISATFYESNDLSSVLEYCREAKRAAVYGNQYDLRSMLMSAHNIAVVKSLDGDHRGALADLQSILSTARAAKPFVPDLFYECLNGLAVELTEVGRLEEAKHASGIVLTSPYAPAYPEWHETAQEITQRGYRLSRSLISLPQRVMPYNVLALPEREPVQVEPLPKNWSARILDLLTWKRKMGKKTNGQKDNNKAPQELSERDIIIKVMNLMTQEGISEKKLLKILDHVEKVLAEPEG